MADRFELLQEAKRRGLLSPDKVALLEEAERRGLTSPQKPQRTTGEELTRQGGLTARHAVEGVTALPSMLANVVALGMNKALEAAGVDYQFPDQSRLISETLTEAGLPVPENATERVVGDVSRSLTAGGSVVQGGKALANATNTVAQGTGRTLSANAGTQAIAEVSGAGAASTAREMDAPPLLQGAIGLTAGAVAPFVPPVAQSTARTIGGIRDSFTQPGQRRIVAETLQDRASSPQGAKQALEESPPTLTNQSTGPVSRDAGLLTLERTLRNTDASGRFANQVSTANLKRQEILDVIGGEDIAVSRAARDASTGETREAALTASDGKALNVAPILNRIDGLLKTPAAARKVVKKALTTARKDIEDITDARTLYEVRKDVNDAMQGKFRNPKRSDFKMAKRELKIIKNSIDDQIESVAPGFKKYLEDYARLSQDIDRREIIQNIQQRSALAVSDPTTGREFLSQAKFKNLVNAERRNGNITEEQLKVLDTIADDMDLGMAINATGIRPTGSDTAKNMTVSHVIGRSLGGQTDSAIINTLARPIKWLTSFSEDQVQGLLADAMLDPLLAKQLLAEARPQNIQRFSKRLRQIADATLVGLTAENIAQSPAPTQ